MSWSREAVAARVDHAVLSPAATAREVVEAAERAAAARVRGVCVAPRHVRLAVKAAFASGVRVVAVAGFPAAGSVPAIVAGEAGLAVDEGAAEVDVVLPWGLLREEALVEVRLALELVVRAAGGAPVKAIVEASEFDDAALARIAAEVVLPAGAAFFKTGTGVYGAPIPPDRIRALRRALDPSLGLKVSGGLRDAATAVAALDAGADVLGMSRTFEVLGGLPDDSSRE